MKKMSFKQIILLMGAIMAYQIGSGFASGQETLQYYASWPNIWGAAVSALFSLIFAVGAFHVFAVAGRESDHEIKGYAELFEFYGGNKNLGKAINVFPLALYVAMYIIMIAGAGNVLNQAFGLNVYIGAAIASVICVFIAIRGLSGIVNSIGPVGVFLCGLVLLVGIITLFKQYPNIPENLELIKSGSLEVLTVGSNPVMAGINLSGVALLMVVAFVSNMAQENKEFRYRDFFLAMFLSMFIVYGTNVVMGLAHLSNITESVTVQIPNLLLIEKMGIPGVAVGFSILIFLAILSTAIPSLWSFARTFYADGSKGMSITIIVLAVVCYFIATSLPYSVIINIAFTVLGYAGLGVFLLTLALYIRYVAKNKALVKSEVK